MKMKRQRKQHSAVFKAKVGLEALKGIKTVGEIAREYQVHPNQVSQWKGEVVQRLPEVFESGPTVQAQERPRADPRLLRGRETVLVVEDEAALRRAAQRILERHGYRVLTAPDGDAALQLLAEPGRTVDLILTDMMMPRSGGADLYHRVMREIGPRRFLVASGYSASEVRGDQELPAAVPFIKKPWTLEEILEAVRKALDAPFSDTA